MSGRTFAIGDIHGCDVALDVLLSLLAPTSDDTVVLLGDVVDRGPQSKRVIERLLDLQRNCNMVTIMGNHEEMMCEAIQQRDQQTTWWKFGGRETVESYGGWIEGIPETHLEFVASGLPYWETESDIFIHANLEPGVPLTEQADHWLRWQRLTGFETPHPSGKRVICGHSAVRTGLPTILDGWVCIDTLAYDGLYLTALDVQSNVISQAQQSGQSRHGVTLNDLM